ncbi:hypothetical protein [Rhodococcus sp. B10]|uniref:hypothetical protein n=1 Tax=Rhodococcus sp. B10 TaxID=2695876 RepID=UPI00142FA92A|nr:hypothetical protein [Rhodococcus sp. B10]NIL77667.1 hypothetical protein [Rhodococcus sp. B10]
MKRPDRGPYIGQPVTRIPQMPKTAKVPAEVVMPHLQHLLSIGMTPCMIARAAGVSAGPLYKILAGQTVALKPTVDALLAVSPRPHPQQANVLAYAARRRLEGLAVMGWPGRAISAQSGLNLPSLHRVHAGSVLSLRTHVAVLDVFDRISHIRRGDIRTTKWAQRRGFVHPMLWDDIDDFYEVPAAPDDSGIPDPVVVERLVDGRRVDATRAERREAWRLLSVQGLPANEIAGRLSISKRTVERYKSEMAVAS